LPGILSSSDENGFKRVQAGHWWLTPVILATQEAEIRRISVQSQHSKRVHENLS
jgi:hypothetical protein